MIAVCKKELRQLTYNLTGPLMLGVVLAILFLYFIYNNLIAWSADIAVPMNACCVLSLTFAVPFLTMRSFAEEQRQRTDQLLLTTPLTVPALVCGKFFALAAFFLIPAAVAALLPLILAPYGDVQFLYSYTAILGFYLYALMITAIGIFISSLTAHPVSAGIMTFLLILLGVVMSNAYASIGIAWLKRALQAVFDFGTRIAGMMSGMFDLTSVIYFVSVCVLFLYLTMLSVQRRRFSLKGEGARMGRMTLALSVSAVVLTVLLNLLANELPAGLRMFDVTGNGLYSISDASRDVAASLQDDITIYYLSPAGEGDTNVERVLEKYEEASPHIALSYVNIVMQPQFYMSYSDTPLAADSVVVVNETTGAFRAIDYANLIETQLNTSNFTQYVTGYDVEGRITGALQALTVKEGGQTAVYFIADHGEQMFESAFEERFTRAGLNLLELNLQTVSAVPDDAAFAVIFAPVADLSKEDADKVLSYLSRGGNLFCVTDYAAAPSLPQFDRILDFYGVRSNRGIVIETDPDGYLYNESGGTPYYVFPLIVEDEVTAGIRDARIGTVFTPLVQSLSYEEEEGLVQTPLLLSSEEAFLKTNPESDSMQISAEDIPGTQTIGLKSVKTLENGEASTAIFFTGPSMFTTAADEQVARGVNSILFGNTISALTPGGERTVTIPVKSFYNTLQLNARTTILWSVILALSVPFVWVMGLLVWWLRRRL